MNLHDLWLALGLMAVIEGVVYALFPQQMKRLLEHVSHLPADTLRLTGLTIAFTGLAFLWLMTRL